jgi:hypothetical protein
MKRLFTHLIAFLAIAVLSACAGMSKAPEPHALLRAGYQTTDNYVISAQVALMRGRITPDQAEKASTEAKKARDKLDEAAKALALCERAPCTDFTALLQAAQPDLLKLEAELRKKEGATK